ncbi:cyclase family protein [Bradyrhizobium sp. 138]|nr:cyclase family protein [Bradyrhizobium sp. 138]
MRNSDQEIMPNDTVLVYMATNDRLYGNSRYAHDFPGLAPESVHWLADKGNRYVRRGGSQPVTCG